MTTSTYESLNSSESSTKVVDAEWMRTAAQEGEWIVIDAVGTARNTIVSVGTGLEIAKVGAAVSQVFAAITPITQIATGSMCVVSALKNTIPTAYQELQGIEEGDHEGKLVAGLGLTNQVFFAKMGAAVTACGIVGMMSPTVAGTLHYAAAMGESAATVASLAAGTALGAIYILRGGVIITKSLYALNYLNKFQKEFHADLDKIKLENPIEGIDEAITNIENQRNELGDGAFQRRVGDVKPLEAHASIKDKIEFLKEIDKGIFTKKLQQQLSLKIGIAMLIGGILLITALVLSGGSIAPILVLISSILFVLMESTYLRYDWTFLFNKLRDSSYVEPEIFKKIEESQKDLIRQAEFEELCLGNYDDFVLDDSVFNDDFTSDTEAAV